MPSDSRYSGRRVPMLARDVVGSGGRWGRGDSCSGDGWEDEMMEGALKQDGLGHGHSSAGSQPRSAILCTRTCASVRLEYIKNVALRRQHAGYETLRKRALILVSMWISLSAKLNRGYLETWPSLLSSMIIAGRWQWSSRFPPPSHSPLFCIGKLGVTGAFPARW